MVLTVTQSVESEFCGSQVQGAHGYQIWRQNEDGSFSIVKTIGDKGNTLTDDQGATIAYSNTDWKQGKHILIKCELLPF